MPTPHSKIYFTFDKAFQVQCCEFSSLIQAFDPATMTPAGLRYYCDSVRIRFTGYQDEPRLPFTIPEVRNFLRAIRLHWPFAPFFCDLDDSFVSIEALAHMDHFSVLERAGSPELLLRIHTPELHQYAKQARGVIRVLGLRARMTAAEIRQRQRRFDDYLARRLGPGKP